MSISQLQMRFRAVVRTLLGPALWAAAFASGIGCAVKAPTHKFDSRHQAAEDIKANANQARLKMRSLVDPMCGQIERSADQIADSTSDPAVRRMAVQWKIEAVPALREALFEPNPFIALADSWVLFDQMADFFETGAGRAALGDWATSAVETCRRLEEEMAQVAASMTHSGDVSRARAFARTWAAEHPIRYAIQDRESTLGLELERDLPDSWSTGEAVAQITTSVDDLNRKIDVYSDHMFRQARWELELLGSDLRLAETMPLAERAVQSAEKAAAALDHLEPQIQQSLVLAQTAPVFIASERKAAIDALGAELTRTIAFVHQERMIAFRQISQERIAGLGEMRKTLSEERQAFDEDMVRTARELVDHAAWRIAQLVAATLLFLLVTGTAALLLVRKLFFAASSR